MKRGKYSLILVLCMGLCLILCACAQAPTYHPPKASKLVRGEVQLAGNKISNLVLVTDHAGESYYYRMKNGIAFTTDHAMHNMTSGELNFGHFDTLLKNLMLGLKETGMGMDNTQSGNYKIIYNLGAKGQNEWIAGLGVRPSGVPLRYAGYYVYSIEGRTFTPGEGTTIGKDPFGFFQVWNYNATDAATRPGEQIEYIYILIGD